MGQAPLSLATALRPLGPGARLFDALLGLVFQADCLLCGGRAGSPLAGATCPACLSALPWRSSHALRAGELAARGPLSAAGAAFSYDGALRKLLHAYKFEGHSSLRRPLARKLAEGLQRWDREAHFDLVALLPPAARSLEERGYDAGGELARDAARLLGLPAKPLLRRSGAAQRQSELDRAGRLSNAQGALSLAPNAIVEGKRVIVFDDILTTGATLQEAARVLAQAGAASVSGFALAHSERELPWP